MMVSKKLQLDLVNIVIMLTLKVFIRDHPNRTNFFLDYLQIETVKVNSKRNRNIAVKNFCVLSKHNISKFIHQCFSFSQLPG